MNKLKKDIITNIIATSLPLFILQLFILPLISKKSGSEDYGTIITLITWLNFIGITSGNVLNNSRLMLESKYGKEVFLDFSSVLIRFLFLNVFLLSMITFFEDATTIYESILFVAVGILMTLKSFGVVEFRLKLNYKYILVENIILTFGMLVGFALYLLSSQWMYIFIIGYVSSVLFILFTTNLKKILKINTKKSKYNNEVKRVSNNLFAGGFLNATPIYIDKILVYYLFGSKFAAIYYVSTLFGKLFSMVITPINNVFLSHIVKMNSIDKVQTKKFMRILIYFGVISYLILLIASFFSMEYLYPEFSEQARVYLVINTLTVVLISISAVINNILLKFHPSKHQFNINLMYLITFLTLTLVFSHYFGLIGFCTGVLLAAVQKLIHTVGIYMKTI